MHGLTHSVGVAAAASCCHSFAHSYLVAVGGRSVYVAFMGTKQARDVQTDLAFSHEAVWAAEEISGRASEVPSAHRGFLARAKSVPINQLQALAEGSGRRLVLCGHSLVRFEDCYFKGSGVDTNFLPLLLG